jgi:hypothetical protein
MMKEQDAQFVAGFAVEMAMDLLNLAPKRKQKEYLKSIQAFNGRQLVTVKNCLTGADVEIRREDRGTVNDPSMERYHSM